MGDFPRFFFLFLFFFCNQCTIFVDQVICCLTFKFALLLRIVLFVLNCYMFLVLRFAADNVRHKTMTVPREHSQVFITNRGRHVTALSQLPENQQPDNETPTKDTGDFIIIIFFFFFVFFFHSTVQS